jgi:hypothetical protein
MQSETAYAVIRLRGPDGNPVCLLPVHKSKDVAQRECDRLNGPGRDFVVVKVTLSYESQ